MELLFLGGLAPEKRTQSILVTGCALLVELGLASEESNESRKNRTVEVEGDMRRCRTNAPMCVSRWCQQGGNVCLPGRFTIRSRIPLGSLHPFANTFSHKAFILTLTRPCSVLCRTLV